MQLRGLPNPRYAREELLSLHVKDFAGGLLSREEKKERENAGGTPWQRAMRGEPDASGIVHYGEHKRKDGTSFPVEVRFGSVDYGGKRTILASVRDITERREAQEALRRTEERFRSLVQNSSDVITVIGPDGTILYQTPSVKRILGHEPEDRVGKNVFENPLIHPDDAARQRDLIDRTVRDPSLNPVFEAQLRHGDGSWRWVEGVVTNLLSDPNVGGIVLNARDIGERKRAEEALEESEQRYRSLFDHHPDAVYAFDLKGCFLSANPACERLTGYTAGELSRMSYVPFIVPEDLERTMRHFEGAARGEPQNYEIAITDKRGRRVELNVTNLPMVVAGEIVGVYGIAKDVTERKRAEEVRSRLATIVESSEDAIVSRAADGTIISWNGGAENLYGYAAEEVVGRSNAFLYPPEHPREMAEILEKIQRGETIRQYETVRVAKDGRRVDVSLTVSPTMDTSGNVVGDSGIARDITERKRAEDELRAVYRRHRETIDSAEAIIWRGDARTLRFTFVSHQAEAILRYPAARWIAEPTFWTEHMHPDDREWALAFCEAATAEKRAHTFEYRMVAADGRVVWLRDSVHVVVKDGVPTELIGVMTDVTERRALEEQLRHQALHDPLTGLPNRALLLDRLTHALERADRRGRCVGVLFLDLDDFKVVNDSLGHEAGDRMLVGAAERLATCLRPGDTLARLGGDEYVALLEDVRGREEATGVAERMAEALREPFSLGAHEEEEVFVSASIGVALGNAGEDLHGGSSDDLLRRADMAMYEAKRKGKAHHEVFEQRMDPPTLGRLRMGTDLRRAIERGEFRVHYQPEVSLRTGRIVGFEALVRWEHPEQGLVPPARFIPVAEETGMIVQMGRWVLEEACRQAKAWHDLQPGGLPLVMSVNLSARQFGHPDLVRDVAHALRKSGLAPNSLVLEITESVVMDDARYTVDTLGELKALGVGLAVDDFGTGYSSLSYLKRFPVDFLKVDRSFVDGLGEDPEDVVLVSGIVDLAHALGLTVVAEGVETEYQLELLRAMGCNLAQGYHFTRPMPGEQVEAFLAARAHPG